MIELLRTFSTLALISGAVLTLLPEGSMRKTAAMALGLMITLCWAQGLLKLLDLPDISPSVFSALSPTDLSLADAEAKAQALFLPPEVTGSP